MLVAGAAGYAGAVEPYKPFDRGITVSNGDTLSMDIWGRGQMMGVGQLVADPYADNFRVYEFLKQARMGFNGAYEDLFKYQVEFSCGGENQNSLQSMAGSCELMDFVADVPIKPLGENAFLKLGQFRVPYGREALGDEGFQDFSDRSIANDVTNHGRDFGLAIMSTKGNWTGTFGTFPDGGRDIAQRYLPETLGIPEMVFRVGYNDGVDGNLLTNAAYNPYMNRADVPNITGITTGLCSGTSCQRGTLWNIGGDAVYRHPMSNSQAVEFEGQVDWAGYQNRYGSLHMASGRIQGDYQNGPWELGVRCALLVMDSHDGFTSATLNAAQHPTNVNPGGTALYQYNAGMGAPIHEITPSITYHFRNHTMKVVADLPIYVNSPLMLDHADGAYAFGDPTGTTQTGVLTTAGNSIVRRTNVSGRMLFQFQF